MRKLLLISFLLILSINHCYSQRKVYKVVVHRVSYWSISVDGGITLPVGDFSNAYKTSGNAGLELAYHPGPNFAFFFNTQYNFLSPKDTIYNGSSGYLELGVGGRLYLGKGPAKFFVEAGFGDYVYHYTLTNFDGSLSYYSQGDFGLKGGLGGELMVARKTSIFVKTDFHTIFTPITRTNYVGIYCGIRFIM
jgi:hypothetical protein